MKNACFIAGILYIPLIIIGSSYLGTRLLKAVLKFINQALLRQKNKKWKAKVRLP